MPTAVELLRQGRNDELWQMCCGYIKFDIDQFMAVQKRLLLGQIESLNNSQIGRKLFHGAIIRTVEDFRQNVPLTDYADYCPELIEKREDTLPEKPLYWVHTSGRSGVFPCKWIPLSHTNVAEMSRVLYGIGLLSCCNKYGDTSQAIENPNIIYTVAPRPYISGALASMLAEQTPLNYLPSLAEAESLPFEERIKRGFEEALSEGLDYFFGLSLVLAEVGTKFSQSATHVNIRPLISRPKALLNLTRGMIKSRIAGRNLLPKDIWNVRGIVTSGLDSSVYKDKIKEYWGRYPLDIYSSTEGGVIATQTWDYSSMTFIPNLNYLEFIPEKEHFKWQLDHEYQPKTVLLDEVEAGQIYEIIITSFNNGALVRYRVGDMVRITSLRNENLGIKIPQMVFERRADDLLDFAVIRLTEKSIWKAIENTGIPYRDWVAYKSPGELTLNILIEAEGSRVNRSEMENALYQQILKTDSEAYSSLKEQVDLANMIKFKVNLTLLPRGSFDKYMAQKIAEGADIAHLKPPHVNPPQRVLLSLLGTSVAAAEADAEPVTGKPVSQPVSVG
jgi:hypothetical protein